MENENKEVKNEAQTNNEPSDLYYLTNTYELDNFSTECEDQRKNVLKSFKSSRMRSNIIMGVVVLIFVAAFILLTQGTWGQITGWVMVGVTVVGMAIYYILSRRLAPNLSKDYCVAFWQKSNDYLFNQEGFKNCYLDLKEKYDLSAVMADRVYENIVDIASRNLVHGKYHGLDFTFGELAFYKAGAKKNAKEVVFVGRHIEFENNLNIDGRIIFNLRGEKGLDVPTDINDLSLLLEKENCFIYGPEGADYKKSIGTETISRLMDININDPLLNLIVVFWHKRTAVYLSYDDSIVAIPFNEDLVPNSYVTLKKNIEDIFDILLNPSKKGGSKKKKDIEEVKAEEVKEEASKEKPVEEQVENKEE